MPAPDVEHLPRLISSLRQGFAAEDGVDPRWITGLDDAELAAIRSNYAQHRSVRILREQLRKLLDLRKLRMQ